MPKKNDLRVYLRYAKKRNWMKGRDKMAKETDDNLLRDAEIALYWLVRWKVAQQRDGWEEGPTSEEVAERITDLLFNQQMDAGVKGHRPRIERFLKSVEKRFGNDGWDSSTLVQ